MNRYFDDVILIKPFLFFAYVLIFINALLMSLYFSGNAFLQSLIVPSIVSLDVNSWREFGLLEMLQNVFLLGLIAILIYGVIKQKKAIDKGLYILAITLFSFLFLEEIDYGLHYYELITGETIEPGQHRNWHNQEGEDGHQNTRKIKRISDILMVLTFFLLPLLSLIKQIGEKLKSFNFVPVIYFSLSVVLALVLSKTAHYFNNNGFGIIDGVQGKLDNNISEFRETSIYYVYVLYALQLVSFDGLFSGDKVKS